MGEGGAVGEGVSSALGLGLGEGEPSLVAAGLELGASGPFAVQPATARSDRRTTTPILTELETH